MDYHRNCILSKIEKLTPLERDFFEALIRNYGNWDNILRPRNFKFSDVFSAIRIAASLYIILRSRGNGVLASHHSGINRNSIRAYLAKKGVSSLMFKDLNVIGHNKQRTIHPVIAKLGIYDEV